MSNADFQVPKISLLNKLCLILLWFEQRRQEELERKAQELRRREEELRNNAPFNSTDITFSCFKIFVTIFISIAQRNNWPPLPDKFCVQPCFYQDINVEIPLEFQKIVRMLYYIWMRESFFFAFSFWRIVLILCFSFLVHTLMYLLNILGCLALFIQLGSGAMFGLAILYAILFTPASYLCWFRPVYKAFRFVIFHTYIFLHHRMISSVLFLS